MNARAAWALACALVVLGTSLPAAATPVAQPAAVSVSVDGSPLGAIGVPQHGGPTLVPVDALAKAVGWHLAPLFDGARLTGDDRTVVIVAGARFVRESGEVRRLFDHPVVARGAQLYLAAGDAARLFGLRPPAAGTTVAFRRPTQLGGETRIAELPRPPTPAPRATPRPVPQAAAEAAAAASAGRIAMSIERSGRRNTLQFASETRGAYLHTLVNASGIDELGHPNATLSFGSAKRHVDVGMLSDPLAGLIFGGGIYEGVSVQRADARLQAFAGHRLDNGRSFAGATLGDPLHGGASSLLVVAHDGAYEDTLFRRYAVWRRPWGDFRSEVLLSDRGAGIGFGARTRGRTFVETAVTAVHGSLPIGQNDAPVRVDVGRELSTATTVVTGFTSGPQQPISPFAALSTRWHDVRASVSATDRTLTASLAYQTPLGTLQFYSVPGAQHTSGVSGTLALPSALVELASTMTAGSTDASLTVRSVRRGINVIGGLASTGGRTGAIAGLSLPVSGLLALEGTMRPAGRGTAVRLGLTLGLPSRRPARAPAFATTVRLDAPAPSAVRLFVDGIPLRLLPAGGTTVEVTRGRHAFSAETTDGTLGSPETSIDVAGAGQLITLPLWPQRALAGRVTVDDPHSVPPDFSLAGIVVNVGDASVETNAEGTFVFGKQPFDPAATIGVDPSSLPRELRAPERRPLSEGEIVLSLRPGLRIERQVFPSSR